MEFSLERFDVLSLKPAESDAVDSIVSAVRHLHVGMTSNQNGGYFWLKTNYRVYLCCLEFLSGNNCSSFFLERKRFQRVH